MAGNGLLDFLSTPEGQGLLAGAFGGLAGARKGQPINSIGRAGMAGLAGYTNAQDQQQKLAQDAQRTKLFDLQFKGAQADATKRDATQAILQQFSRSPAQTALSGGGGPTLQNAEALQTAKPSFDYPGYADALAGVDPSAALSLKASLQKETPFDKIKPESYTPESLAQFTKTRDYGVLRNRDKQELAPSGQVWNPYQAQPGQTMPDPNKPFTIGPDGKPVANQGFQSYEISKAKAGKTNVNLAVNTEKSLLTTMGEGLGKQLDSSLAGAQSAQNTINTAQQIKQLVGSGKVITGPGADYRVTLARLGDAMGIGGKDNAEKLSNTAQLVQGLAKTELDSSKSIAGQGPVTDFERTLIRRAAAGDLSMTPGELNTLAGALDKSGRARIKQHQAQVSRLQQMPGAAPLIPFYSVDEPGSAISGGASAGGPKFLGFE